MSNRDSRVDLYINNSAEFAKPILIHLRELVHKACPEVKETIKWGFPCYEYKGMLCSMASFKNHCAFNFWKGGAIKDTDKIFSKEAEGGMGTLGKITDLREIPSDKIMIKYLKEAIKLNDEGVKVEKKPKEKKELVVPEYFSKELKKYPTAFEVFNSFSESHKREYVDWVVDAKREETREKRIKTAIEWMSEGKNFMWKYEKKKV
jgi:uncharacterized protein YdeI (YjbR/CyaY-like superfamily)